MSARRRPRKPTTPYGYLNFSKLGSVEKKMFRLSSEKKNQERQVVEDFVSRLQTCGSSLNGCQITELPEADHDFLLKADSGNISVQLTEISDRDYTIAISEAEYNSGRHKSFLVRGEGVPLAVDEVSRDTSIQRAIAKKISKNYAKGVAEKLWLLIFATNPYLKTIYHEAGERKESPALCDARRYLANLGKNPFDEIWFSNLLTSPVQIWPISEFCVSGVP